MILRKNPVFAISITEMRLLPKTMALGGVATGSINATRPSMAGSIKSRGLGSMLTTSTARMGYRVSTVAILEVILVKKVIGKQMHRIRRRGYPAINFLPVGMGLLFYTNLYID